MNRRSTARLGALALLLACAAAHAAQQTFTFDTSTWQQQPKSMHVAGDFNSWSVDATPMRANAQHVWTASLNVDEGQHAYKFVADSNTPTQRWLPDPKADHSLDTSDGNGGTNSGVIVGLDVTKLPPPQPNAIDFHAVLWDRADPTDLSISGNAVRVRLRAQQGDVQSVTMQMLASPLDTAPKTFTLQRIGTERGFDIFSGLFSIDGTNVQPGGHFVAVSPTTAPTTQTAEGGVRPVNQATIYSFELTDGTAKQRMTGADFQPKPSTVPAWASDANWYQIFVDRFRNGDASNDPGDYTKYERLIPWNADWWKTQPNETPGDENFYKGTGNVWNRRYGGDLQGVIEELPYLRSLGVNAIYLNPIFEAESMHKYDTADYRHVDDNFGVRDATHGPGTPIGNHEFFNLDGSPAAAPETEDPKTWHWSKSDLLLLKLVESAHQQGFHVILDGVFNHVGRAHPFFLDVLKNGKRSKYANWFEITDWGDPKNWHEMPDPFAVHGKPGGIQWKAWDGANGWLPALKKDPTLGIGHGPREHILAIAKRWEDPDGDPATHDGIDGWRLDAANEVPHPFWVDFRKAVREANPEAYIDGEIWSPSQAWVNDGKQFDAVMNYQFAMAAQDFFVNQSTQLKPSAFNDRLVRLWFMYPAANVFAMQNLFDSHDTDRLASMMVNPDRPYDGQDRLQDNATEHPYSARKPNEQEWQRVLQAVAFQQTFAGAPMTYYGDEAGMWSPDDPSNRQPLPWDDKGPYADSVGLNKTIFAGFQRFIAIRNHFEALRDGAFEPVKIDDDANVYAFARQTGDQRVYVVINRSGERRSIELSDVAAGDYVNYADPASVRVEMPLIQIATARPVVNVNDGAKRFTPTDGKLTIDVPAYGVAILGH